MKTITIQIKNMVCLRCVHVVKQILHDLNISFTEVDLGYATLNIDPFPDFDLINEKLEVLDLGLICDQNELLIAEINKAIHCYMENISWIGHRQKLSDYIAKEVARNYHQLSKVYSRYSGITIEQYFIDLRTNKVKELIRQGDLNLSQIAITVGYSGIHYLSGQFKKYTGMSLSDYRKSWEDEICRSFERQASLKTQPEKCTCGCGCEDCHCAESQNGQAKQDNPVTPVLLSACTSPADNEDVDVQAEKANVEEVIKAYKAGIERLSVEGLTGLFMKDSEIFESGGEEGSFTHYLAHHLAPELEVFESFDFNDHKIKVKIDMPYAFTTETYTYKIVLKSDGKLIERKGVATSILKKENDQWKIMKTHTSARAMNS